MKKISKYKFKTQKDWDNYWIKKTKEWAKLPVYNKFGRRLK